ncbi:helix-turn-helix transcriptional regulator [Rosistilla oblonga]|uniref:helix-turn-helix transcriptional regulator n=1 Tax=Rosistilla oblonga TaxID=2527990 RepID=UPI003A972182
MARNEQLIRQHKILQLLEDARYGRTLDEIRDDLITDLGLSKLHERTVRRDIEALQSAGYDLDVETNQRGKVWKLGRVDRGIHKISATATELIALSIGRDLLNPLAGTQYWQGVESFWNKLEEEVPNGVYDHYSKFRETLCVYGVPTKTYEKHAGILRTINRAIVEHRIVEIDYQSPGRAGSTRRIEPYGLAIYQSSIYVIAAAEEVEDPKERMRHWKLDRFTKATALDEWFKPDPDVDIQTHLNRSFGIFSGEATESVQIRLSSFGAAWVREDPWHTEQQLDMQPDGGAILTVSSAHPRELMPKLLSLGAEAEVIGPESFRTAVTDVIARLAKTYAVEPTDGH